MQDVAGNYKYTFCISCPYALALLLAWYPAQRKSTWYTLMCFRLIKNGVAYAYDVYTV